MTTQTKPAAEAQRNALLLEIAERHLFLETLETRNSDRLDFHEHAILAPSACAMIAAHNWIVIDDFGPMIFTLTPAGGKHRATCTGHGRAHKVNRFTKHDAERLATACNARAAFWADAARAEVSVLIKRFQTSTCDQL